MPGICPGSGLGIPAVYALLFAAAGPSLLTGRGGGKGSASARLAAPEAGSAERLGDSPERMCGASACAACSRRMLVASGALTSGAVRMLPRARASVAGAEAQRKILFSFVLFRFV